MVFVKNYYNVLGVSENATKEEIKKAWHVKAQQKHQDLNGEETKAAFQEVQEAYENLSKEDTRKKHDEDLRKYRTMGSNTNVNNNAPKQYASNVMPDFVKEILNSYNHNYTENKRYEEIRKVEKKITEVDEKIRKVEIDILVIKRKMSTVVHNEYNNKVNEVTIYKSSAISSLSSKMTDERNRKRFLSAFFPKIDEKIRDKYNSKIKEVELEFEKKITQLKNAYESRLNVEDKENEEKQKEIEKKLSDKMLLEQQKEQLRQIIYPNTSNSYTNKAK